MGGDALIMYRPDFDVNRLSGRDRRLFYEWSQLERAFGQGGKIRFEVAECNSRGLPIKYRVAYHIRSIQGVERVEALDMPGVSNPPIFASLFLMTITLPDNYPCVDAPVEFRFLTCDEAGKAIPHPWHPNIRYFGEFAGRVCLNTPDTYASLLWGVRRVALYLRYDLYHAAQHPPYPEDPKVARWVVRQGEPNGWVYFDQN